MTTYYANFEANNGTRYAAPIKGTNKAKLIQDIRSIAEAERFQGNECSWRVWIKDGEDCINIAHGGISDNGSRWRDNERYIMY